MPNDFTMTNNTTNNRWDLAYSVDAAGTKTKTIKTGGTFVDKDILVSVTTPSASTYSLNVTSISGSSDVTVGTLLSGKYPIKASNVSVTGTLSAGSAGWFSSASATDSDTDNVTIGKMTAAVIAASATGATATTTVAPGTVSIDGNTTGVSGKTRLDLTPSTATTGIGTYYIAIKATAAANSTGTTSAISGTATASVTTAGYAPTSLTGTANISGTATAKTSAKDSAVYYIPVTSNAGTIGGTATSGTSTAVLTNTNSIATISDISGKTAGTDYWGIKATTTTSNGSYTPSYTVTTAGWLANTVTGTAQTVSVTADSTGQTIYIPKATFTVSGSTIKSNTAGYIPANTSVGSISTITPTFAGGGLTTNADTNTVTKPTVTIAETGTFTSTGKTTYGVTTTKPSGTDGTNYLTINESHSITKGSAISSWGVDRAAMTYSNTAGYLAAHDGTSAISANSTSGGQTSEIDVTITDNFESYYMPIVTPTFSGGTVSGSTTTTISTNMKTTSSSSYYIDATATGTANRTAVTYTNSAGAITSHSGATASAAPTNAVNVGSSATRIYIPTPSFTFGKDSGNTTNYTTEGTSSDYNFYIRPKYQVGTNSGGYLDSTNGWVNIDTYYYKIIPTSVSQGTTTISNGTVTRGTASWGNGWVTSGSISAATFANSATSGKTYVDISDTTSAPILISNNYLYINKGYTDDLKISLAKLVPNGASANLADSHILSGYSAYNNDGILVAGNIPTNDVTDVSFSNGTFTVAPGYYSVETTKDIGAATITSGGIGNNSTTTHPMYNSTDDNFTKTWSGTINAPTVNTAGYISSSVGTKNTNSFSKTFTFDKISLTSEKTSGNLTVAPTLARTAKPSGDTWVDAASGAATTTKPTSGPYVRIDAAANTNSVTIKGKVSTEGYGSTSYYNAADTTYTVGAAAATTRYIPITTATLPTAATSSATSGYSSKATISRSTSDQYINIPPGYNTAGGYYKISAVANGSVTAPSSISGSSATVSTGTNTLTLSKTISVTPNVTTAGYISSGTAGNSSISLTASVTTKGTTTYTPTTTDQEIAAGTYLTGKQTIKGDANLTASNIADGVTIFGILGTHMGGIDTSDATLNSNAQMLSGVTAYSNGVKYTGSIPNGTITNNTTLTGTSSGTINRGSYIKIGAGYYSADKYYLAQANSGTKTITAAGTTSVDGYANVSLATAAGSVEMTAGSGSCQIGTDANNSVTFSDTNTSGVVVNGSGSGSVTATAKITTAGYAALNNSFATGTSTASNTANTTKYITGIKLIPPSSGTRTFTLTIPNGSTSDFIDFVFTVDDEGNVTIDGLED